MNAQEQHEVHEITERLDRYAFWTRWVLTGLAAVGAAGFAFALSMEGRQSKTERTDESQNEMLEDLAEDISDARILAAQRGAEISGLTAKLDSQGQTLNRISKSLDELTRYLRDEGVPR